MIEDDSKLVLINRGVNLPCTANQNTANKRFRILGSHPVFRVFYKFRDLQFIS